MMDDSYPRITSCYVSSEGVPWVQIAEAPTRHCGVIAVNHFNREFDFSEVARVMLPFGNLRTIGYYRLRRRVQQLVSDAMEAVPPMNERNPE